MAAELIAEDGLLKGIVLSFEEGDKWVIGRDPESSGVVVEDPMVSRKALLIRKTDHGYFIENLSETNPILVNNHPILEPILLEEGDRLTIGSTIYRFTENLHARFYFQQEAEPEDFDEAFTQDEDIEPIEESTPEEQPEESAEEEEVIEANNSIFEEEPSDFSIDLTHETRYLLKVIAGPNTGAEFALEIGKSYLIGTDTTTCDIIFNDLSVSREHARLSISDEGVSIEDLDSRNGVVINRERVSKKAKIDPNAITALGTSAFLLIDKEAPAETIAAAFEPLPREEEREEKKEEQELLPSPIIAAAKPKVIFHLGALLLSLCIAGLIVLFTIGLVSLVRTKEIPVVDRDYFGEIEAIVKDFPAVRFTYNKTNQRLFLMGHVKTGVDQSELLYRLRGLNFISAIEDNVVNDEAVWQDMNILLSKNPDFKGISMHSPEPGVFVLNGYLKTEKQAAELMDYMNVNFNYLNLLQNRVVVEEEVTDEVTSTLTQKGFGAINVSFSNGDLQLTGYVTSTQNNEFVRLIDIFKKIAGVRNIKNYVVMVSPEQGVIDLNRKYPGKYKVTGYSKHGEMNINVVINGKILTRGDILDGMTITSIQPHAIFLEKDGLKYKIEYNK